MNNTTQEASLYANISKIVNFFRRTPHGGFLFCLCDNGEVINNVNDRVVERAGSYGLRVTTLYVSSDDVEGFLSLVRKAAGDKPDGIIIKNLDELILHSQGEFIACLNFAREPLIELNVPFLFWFSEKNMSLVANKGRDFFIRKDRGIISFAGVTGVSSLKRLETFYASDQKGREIYDGLNVKIELLEQQLEEAVSKGYNEKRIATEIAADLILLYKDAYLNDEANALFNKYKQYYEESNQVKHVVLCARMYAGAYEWDKALEFYFKSERIRIEVGDKAGLGTTYNNIGLIYDNKGEWDKALEFYFKSERISIEVGDKAVLGTTYNNIGSIYSNKGEWDKALEFYFKGERICIEVGDKARLGYTALNMATVYYKLKDKRAKSYIDKSVAIFTEIGAQHELENARQGQAVIHKALTGGFLLDCIENPSGKDEKPNLFGTHKDATFS